MKRFLLGLIAVSSLHAAGPTRVAWDAKVADWDYRCSTNIAAATADRSIANNTFSLIVSSLWMRDVRAAGLYPGKIYRRNLFCGRSYGGTLGAGDSNVSINIGSPQVPIINDVGGSMDVANTPQQSWFYKEQGSTGGLGKGGGTDVWLDTGFNPSTAFAVDTNAHFSVYVETASTEASFMLGCAVSPAGFPALGLVGPSYTGVGTRLDFWNGNLATAIADSNGNGFYLGNKVSGGVTDLYKAASLFQSTSGQNATTRPNASMAIFGNRFGAGVSAPSAKLCGGYSFGLAMSATEEADLYNADQAAMTRFARQK